MGYNPSDMGKDPESIESFDDAVGCFLEKAGIADPLFIIAVGADGVSAKFRAPDARVERISAERLRAGIDAKIKVIRSSSIIHYEGSKCAFVQDHVSGGTAMTDIFNFCKP